MGKKDIPDVSMLPGTEHAVRVAHTTYWLAVIAFDNVYDLYCRLNGMVAGALFHIPCSVA